MAFLLAKEEKMILSLRIRSKLKGFMMLSRNLPA